MLGDAADRRMWRLDELTGRTQATIDLPFPPRSIAVGNGQVWITDPLDDAVVPISAADNRLLAPVPVGRGAAGVTCVAAVAALAALESLLSASVAGSVCASFRHGICTTSFMFGPPLGDYYSLQTLFYD